LRGEPIALALQVHGYVQKNPHYEALRTGRFLSNVRLPLIT